MQQLNFEHHPLFIIVGIAAGLLFAWIQYQKKAPWSKTTNRLLFLLRTVLVSLLAILLVSPIFKQIINEIEKPVYVIAIDNSKSLTQFRDSVALGQLLRQIEAESKLLETKGFNVELRNLEGTTDFSKVSFTVESTNLHSFFESIESEFEGRNLGGVLLISDGIYNTGMSAAFSNYSFEINSVGIGDTLAKPDLAINALLFNRLSYQGNKFPITVQYSQQGFNGQQAILTLRNGPETLIQKTVDLPSEGQLKEENFLIEATKSGFQRYQVTLSRKPNEQTYENNSKTAYVEIIDGQESIALLAVSPHPDIKAIRSAIESNANYELQQFVLSNAKDLERLKNSSKKFDLVIYHQLPGRNNEFDIIFNEMNEMDISSLHILGSQSDITKFNAVNDIVTIKATGGEYDQITAAFNPEFESFKLSDELQESFDQFPPLVVSFGKYENKARVNTLLYQRVGNITTSRPLLAVTTKNDLKRAVFTGQGIWKWKLTDYANNGNNNHFNELITKLIQYLSTKDDKRKFKVYTSKNEYTTREGVVFETQIYNDLYEEIYGNQVNLKLTDQEGNAVEYDFVTSESNAKYTVTGLPEGVYSYVAKTILSGNNEEVKGELVIKELQLESQNLIADFSLLRKLGEKTGGSFFKENEWSELKDNLNSKAAQGTIHSREELLPFINLEWIMVVLILLLSTEWFIRKYHGSY